MKLGGFTESLAAWGSTPAVEIDAAADRLNAESTAASRLRQYRQHPDVVALTIERTQVRVERVLMAAMTCGLLYTTVNVQHFAAASAAGIAWLAAWLIEPTITAGVLALLRIDQVARQHGVEPGSWVTWTRRVAFAVTYAFNTWDYWRDAVPSQVLLHSAIPVLVFCFAEALTDGRDALARAAVGVAGTFRDEGVRTDPGELHRTTQETVEPPDEDDGAVPIILRPDGPLPKGHLKQVVIPRAYRALAEEAKADGRSLDTISLTQIDRRAGTNKYVTSEMAAALREIVEHEWEEQGDGVAC